MRPVGGKPEDAKIVEVKPMLHQETLQAPKAVAQSLGGNVLRVTLLQPDEIALEAVGSYSGVRSRGVTISAVSVGGTSSFIPSYTGGQGFIAIVQLDGPAPSGGLVVYPVSFISQVTVPASITIAEGQTQGRFDVQTQVVLGTITTGISVYTDGGGSKSASFTLTPPQVYLSLSPTSYYGGSTFTGIVSLNVAAPKGGYVVSVGTSNTTLAQISFSTITVPEGTTGGIGKAGFSITTAPVRSTTYVTVYAGPARAVLTLTCKRYDNFFGTSCSY